MKMNLMQLSILAYANGLTLWHYVTQDDAADVATTGYFDPAADMVCDGDMIMLNVAGAVGAVVVVKSCGGGKVSVDNPTLICVPDPQ